MLQQVTQRPDEVTHNIASQNNDKNRSNQFLPRMYKKCERREGVRKKEEAKGCTIWLESGNFRGIKLLQICPKIIFVDLISRIKAFCHLVLYYLNFLPILISQISIKPRKQRNLSPLKVSGYIINHLFFCVIHS